MKEYLRIKFRYDYSLRLFKEDEGINLYDQDHKYLQFKVVEIEPSSPKIEEIKRLREQLLEEEDVNLYWYIDYIRKYSKEDLENAELFMMIVRKYFEPMGEELGTEYDDSCKCPICGSGIKQITPLYMKKRNNYFKNRDVLTTHAPEIIVSKKFVDLVKENNLKGMVFGDVYFGKHLADDCFQLKEEGCELSISPKTRFGVDFFNNDEVCPLSGEVFKCPNGDNLGLNIISEAYVEDSPLISQYDFFISRQTYGVRRGMLHASHILFCSPRMKKLIEANHVKGFNFEIAHIVRE